MRRLTPDAAAGRARRELTKRRRINHRPLLADLAPKRGESRSGIGARQGAEGVPAFSE